MPFSVIPAKAGIQCFKELMTDLDPGFRRGDDFLRVHHSSIENSLRGHNTCFYCLGVSQSKVRDEKKYHEMTYDYTIAGAKTLAQLNEEFPFGFPLEKAIHCSCAIRNKITIEPLFKSSDFRDIHAQLRKSP